MGRLEKILFANSLIFISFFHAGKTSMAFSFPEVQSKLIQHKANVLALSVSGWHSSSNPCSSVYRGSGPSSEIEVKNVLKYLNSIQSSLIAFYDLHSFGQNVLYPWAFTIEKAPDDTELVSQIVSSYCLNFALSILLD